VRELELDFAGVGPLDPVESALGTLQLLAGARLEALAEDDEGGVAEEDQPAAGAQQPRRLRDPPVRVGPDRGAVLREGEVERRVRKRDALADTLEQRELEPELPLQLARRRQLRGVGSTPTGRAPRLASQAEKYAVPQPSSTTSRPATSPITPSWDSGISKIPQSISSFPQARRAVSPVCSAFAFVQISTFRGTYSG
jgi:hypothetical protein